MGIVMDAAEATSLLHGTKQGPLTAVGFRSALLTRHALAAEEEVRWSAQTAEGTAMAVMVVAIGGLRVQDDRGTVHDVPDGRLVFLHPERAARIVTPRPSTLICAWVPWSVLEEVERSGEIPPGAIPDTALARGLSSFLESATQNAPETRSHTDAVMERLIGEMLFGILADAVAHGPVRPRAPRPIDRARARILARHIDPDFDVSTLAREMHLSHRQVQRLFAAEGSTAADELRRLRIGVARELLDSDGGRSMRISEIARRAGFRDRPALRRALAAVGAAAPRAARTVRP